MKNLNILLVSDDNNNFLYNNLKNIGLTNINTTNVDGKKVVNKIINSNFDIVFLDINYLGYHKAIKTYNSIETITGKVCIYIKPEIDKFEDEEYLKLISESKYGYIEYNCIKIDLLTLIINSLNKFNKNIQLRNEKYYDFIYIILGDLQIKKIKLDAIKEIIKFEKSTYIVYHKYDYTKRIINITFEKIYSLLNNDFEKQPDKIINKNWMHNTKLDTITLSKSA